MKTIKLASASRTLAEYAAELTDDIVVLFDGGRPVAAIVPLTTEDSESLALGSHPRFLKLIARARRSVARGQTVTLSDMKRAFAADHSRKTRQRATARASVAARPPATKRRTRG